MRYRWWTAKETLVHGRRFCAAMRYTKPNSPPISDALLTDPKKSATAPTTTIRKRPRVLPALLPNQRWGGTVGLDGPHGDQHSLHNLTELISGIVHDPMNRGHR